jgi:hypothetical protein
MRDSTSSTAINPNPIPNPNRTWRDSSNFHCWIYRILIKRY